MRPSTLAQRRHGKAPRDRSLFAVFWVIHVERSSSTSESIRGDARDRVLILSVSTVLHFISGMTQFAIFNFRSSECRFL